MKTEIVKQLFDGRKTNKLGTFSSLEAAHVDHDHYDIQQTHADISKSAGRVSYLHLIEYRNDEHVNDLFFTKDEIDQSYDHCSRCGCIMGSDSDCDCN